MAILTQVKFHFNQLLVTLIFGIRASALRTTEKTRPLPSKRLKRLGFIGLNSFCQPIVFQLGLAQRDTLTVISRFIGSSLDLPKSVVLRRISSLRRNHSQRVSKYSLARGTISCHRVSSTI